MKEGQKGSMAKRLWPHLNVILITDTNGSDPYGKQVSLKTRLKLLSYSFGKNSSQMKKPQFILLSILLPKD